MTNLVMCLLAAAPLQVRVLEHAKPVKARLEARAASCDGKPLPQVVELTSGQREVRADKELCAEVVAKDATVTLGDATRSYPGTLHVLLEGEFLRFIDEVELEDYLPSVVDAEMSGAPTAALEAQAIVSRTFAAAAKRRHAKAGYDLCDLSHCQVYRGRTESTAAKAAVEKTKGSLLLVGGVVLRPTFFHAACGGHTSSAADVFLEDGGGSGVGDLEGGAPLCKDAPDFTWEWTVERLELAKAVGASPRAEAPAFEPLRRDEAGRVVELKSFGRRFTGADFLSAVGRTLGWQSLRSLKVSAEEVEGQVHFKGSGLGHGVGLCQHGARALAAKGLSTKDILQRYFPAAQLKAP